MTYTIINNLFIERQKDLSGNAVKLYVYLSKCINLKENGNRVWPSYTSIRGNTGIKHNQSVKNAVDGTAGFEVETY